MSLRLLKYGGAFYVRADEEKAIPPEKLQQYIIDYYNKEAKPLGKKAERYLKDHLTELKTALEYYRKVGLVLGERPFEVALGWGEHKLNDQRLDDATDNFYLQMSRLTAKTNQRYETDYKNLLKTQKQQKAAKRSNPFEKKRNPFEELRQERLLAEKALRYLNENDKEVRTVTESLHQSIVEAISRQMKMTVQLMERTKTEPFLLMLTRHDGGKSSWMHVVNQFKFGLTELFDKAEELQEEAQKRFEKAKTQLAVQQPPKESSEDQERRELREDIGRRLRSEKVQKEGAMTTPKTLNYRGRTYHLVEAAENNPKFEGFPEIIKQKPMTAEDLKSKATALRNIGMRLRQVGHGETSGEAVQAVRALKQHLETLMKGYEMLSEFESFFPAKVKLMGNEQRALGLYEEALAKLAALDESTDLWGKNMGRWAHMVSELAAKRQSEETRRPDPTDDPSKMKAPPQTVRF